MQPSQASGDTRRDALQALLEGKVFDAWPVGQGDDTDITQRRTGAPGGEGGRHGPFEELVDRCPTIDERLGDEQRRRHGQPPTGCQCRGGVSAHEQPSTAEQKVDRAVALGFDGLSGQVVVYISAAGSGCLVPPVPVF